MTQDSSLRRMASRLAARGRALKMPQPVRPDPAMIDRLASEFGVSSPVMSDFVKRFSPAMVSPNQFQANSDTMLFVHIPKTAGMSVGKALQQTFDHFYGVEWNNAGASFRKLARRAAYMQSRANVRQVIIGHYGWAEIQFWHNQELPVKSGTILRDPVQRMISNFNYNSSEAHPAHKDFIKRHPTIEGYIGSTDFDVQLTQAIGMVSSFEDVLRKLTAYYSFIGVTERLGQSLSYLSRSHGLPPIQEYHANVGSKPAEELSESVRQLILDRNHNDCKIHALMMHLYAAADSA
ncbi:MULTISPECIES: sulfotransferase family 2 domain-containing protein [Paracoccus]|uniref:sulfotransferase family 2 domain-containing protein n=1 Tax=Paracoccus TaxID=265 RepID=UPI0023F0759B|nr:MULTISPECIES: sulfotransferase family 2 domain-containing protein [Paracoccus]